METANKIFFEPTVQNKVKKVTFRLQTQVHLMLHWDYAFRAARQGSWEQIARDHERFRRRILLSEEMLKSVLSTQHRQTIFERRFK